MKKSLLFAALLPLAACAVNVTGGSGSGTSGTPESACTDCIHQTVTWGPNGGLVAYTEESTISSCRAYQHTKTPAYGAPPGPASPEVCTVADFGGCGAPAPTIQDVEQALANADVVAALADNVPLYGTDPRPCDGVVTSIAVGGHTILVGGDCTGGEQCLGVISCTPVPKGVRALVDLLDSVDQHAQPVAMCVQGL